MKFYKNDKAILGLFNGEVESLEEVNIGSTDASTEKHVPVYFVNGDVIDVHVGEILHPMEENHYIMWIALDADDKFYMARLKPNEEAKAVFKYQSGMTLYSYCNKHLLWKVEVE